MPNVEKWLVAQKLIDELEQEGMKINSGEVKADNEYINALNAAIHDLHTLAKYW